MRDITLLQSIRSVAAVALQCADTLVPEWLPEGQRRATEWVSRNPTRADRHAGSFSVSLADGCWHDFATGDGGGDLVSLGAYLWNVRQTDAARTIAQRLALSLPGLDNTDTIPPVQREAQQRRTEAACEESERRRHDEAQSRQRRQKLAALRAVELLTEARTPTPEHAYLRSKRLPPLGLYQHGNDLLVPLCNINGELVNVQTIGPDGRKLFLRDGQMRGAFCVIGDFDLTAPEPPPHDIYICEGWATGAALIQFWAIDAVVCAMNAGNLGPVALALRQRYGAEINLVIAADDDRSSKDNPGAQAANKAGLLVGCMLISPDWPPGAPAELSDFNDLMIWTMEHDTED